MTLKLENNKNYIIEEFNKGRSILNLAKEFNRDSSTIKSILEKYLPNFIPRSNSFYRTTKNNTILNTDHLDIINGILLGDGGIKSSNNRTPSLVLKNTNKYWVYSLSYLLPFACHFHNVAAEINFIGGKYVNCKEKYVYTSKVDLCLKNIKEKWYGDIKQIPKDLKINPLTLLHWFYGDGSSSYTRSLKNHSNITLCTDNFTIEDVEFLQKLLLDIDIISSIQLIRQKHPRLVLSKKSEVHKFYEYIKPVHYIESFDYKFKYSNPLFKYSIIKNNELIKEVDTMLSFLQEMNIVTFLSPGISAKKILKEHGYDIINNTKTHIN